MKNKTKHQISLRTLLKDYFLPSLLIKQGKKHVKGISVMIIKRMKYACLLCIVFLFSACQLPSEETQPSPIVSNPVTEQPTQTPIETSPIETPVLSEPLDPILLKIQNAKDDLIQSFHQRVLKDSISFPYASLEGVFYQWLSSDPDVLSNDGMVNRPLPGQMDQDITMTIVLSYEDYEESIQINIKVLAYVLTHNIYDLHENHRHVNTISVEVLGIIYAFYDSGFFMTDGTSNIGVAYPSNHAELNLGDLVLVNATYYGATYLNTTIGKAFHLDWTHPVKVLSKGHDYSHEITPITFAEYHQKDPNDPHNMGKGYKIFGRITDFPYDKINDTTSLLDLHFPYLAMQFETDPPGKEYLKWIMGEYVEITVYYFDYDPYEGFIVTLCNEPYQATIYPYSSSYTDIDTLHHRAFSYEEINFEGIVVHISYNGYYLSDGIKQIYVTQAQHLRKVVLKLGDLIEVTGLYQPYYTGFQISYVSKIEIKQNSVEYSLSYESWSIEQIHEAYQYDHTYLDKTDEIRKHYGNMYEVIGTLVKKGAYDGFYLRSLETDAELWLFPSVNQTQTLDLLESYVDLDIIIKVFYHASDGQKRIIVIFDGDTEDIRLYLDPEKMIQQDMDKVVITPNVVYYFDLNLPSIGTNGTLFSWSSSHPEYIASDGTFVSHPEIDTWVTLTATAVLGDLTRTFSKEVLAKASPDQVSDLLHLKQGDWVVIEGVVMAHDWHTFGYFIQDSLGQGIYVESNNIDYYLVEVGQTIVISGQLSTYTEFSNLEPILIHSTLIQINESHEDIVVFDVLNIKAIHDAFPNQYAKTYRLYGVLVGFYTDSGSIGIYSSEHPNLYLVFVDWYLEDSVKNAISVGSTFEWIEFTYCRIYYGYHYIINVHFKLSE
jgi:hypothetical protein